MITDKHWFKENILCLLSNAVKYSNGGRVNIFITHIPVSDPESEVKTEENSEYSNNDINSDSFKCNKSTNKKINSNIVIKKEKQKQKPVPTKSSKSRLDIFPVEYDEQSTDDIENSSQLSDTMQTLHSGKTTPLQVLTDDTCVRVIDTISVNYDNINNKNNDIKDKNNNDNYMNSDENNDYKKNKNINGFDNNIIDNNNDNDNINNDNKNNYDNNNNDNNNDNNNINTKISNNAEKERNNNENTPHPYSNPYSHSNSSILADHPPTTLNILVNQSIESVGTTVWDAEVILAYYLHSLPSHLIGDPRPSIRT